MFLFEDDPGKNKYIEIAYKVHYKIACNFYINKVIKNSKVGNKSYL